jgi:phosphopentomutase
MGLKVTANPATVMKWYRNFRKIHKFVTPNRKKHNLPPFLQQNPSIVTTMEQFGRENLVTEKMVNFLHDVALLKMVADEEDISVQEVLANQENMRKTQNNYQSDTELPKCVL